MFFTIPNILTISRILLTPFFLVLLLSGFFWTGSIIYTIVFITDLLDGMIARHYNQSSKFGAFLDPVADKMMVLTCLFYMVYVDNSLMLFVLAYISLFREIAIMAMRQWFSLKNEQSSSTSSWLAKWKTVIQGVSFMFFFYSQTHFFTLPLYDFGLWLLSISVILSLFSMFKYVKVYRKECTSGS